MLLSFKESVYLLSWDVCSLFILLTISIINRNTELRFVQGLWTFFLAYAYHFIHVAYALVGIPNSVCGCILGWRSVPYHVLVTVTLNSDLVSRMGIESGAYLLNSLRYESQSWCVDASWDDGVSHTVFGSRWSWPDLVSRIGIESGAYLLYSLR